jgi:hypothetical protein
MIASIFGFIAASASSSRASLAVTCACAADATAIDDATSIKGIDMNGGALSGKAPCETPIE